MLAKIPWLSIGRFLLILLCLVLVLGLVVTILPIHLDITAFKGSVEGVLTTAMEAPVTLERVTLHPSLWPTLRIFGVEVAGLGWESAPPLASIGAIELKISLIGLLRRQIRLKKLHVSGVYVRAHRPEGRSGNWPRWGSDPAYRITELADVDLDSATVELTDHHTVTTRAVIDHLTADISESRALDLELLGSLEDSKVALSVGGPTLATLTQASDFPLVLELGLADLTLDLEGTVSREPKGTKFLFSFRLVSTDFALVRELGFADLPAIGEAELTGELSNREATLQLQDLEGAIGPTTVHGYLSFDRRERESPHIGGRLSLGTLDLGPWLTASTSDKPREPVSLPIDLLSVLDADLKLSALGLDGLETEIENLSLEIGLENGDLSIPGSLEVGGVPLSSELELTTSSEVPALAIHVEAQDLTTSQLEELVQIPDALGGRIAAVDLEVTSTGTTTREIVSRLMAEATIREAVVTIESEAGREGPIEIQLDETRAKHRPGTPLTVHASGQLFEESFSVDVETAALPDLLTTNIVPLRAQLRGAGATLEFDGALEPESSPVDVDFEFKISGERLGDLAQWLRFPSHLDLPYSLHGRWTSVARSRLISLGDSSIGRTQFTGEFARDTADPSQPFMVDIHAYTLDLRELRDIASPVTNLDTQEDKLGIDMPILPSRFRFRDAEIDLRVDRLIREMVDITDIGASFHFQEGILTPSPFEFAYDTQRFDGEINLDLRAEVPSFSMDLHGTGEALGEILEHEGLAEGFEITASSIDFRIDAAGSSVRQIIRSADLSGELSEVEWRLRPPEFEEPLLVSLGRVELSGPKNEPIVLSAAGTLNQVPLDLRLALRFPKPESSDPSLAMPFEAHVGLAETDIELRGEAQLPLQRSRVKVQLLVEGKSLATLSTLADRELPDIGPYRFESLFSLTEQGYDLSALELEVEESQVQGEIQYLRVDERPTFNASLVSDRIRTEDFFDLEPPVTEDAPVVEEPEAPQIEKTGWLTLERFNGFDASIELEAQKIITAGGQIDNMLIDLDLAHGSLDLLLQREQDSGSMAELEARIRPWGPGIEVDVQGAWDQQPYGAIADLINPNAAGGSWGVDFDLSSRGADLEELTGNLSGHFYFADYPIDFNATLFDLWGGGLLNSLLPVFQIGDESKVNCTVAKFQLDQGLMTPESLIVDTTRTRISGKGTIDLPNNKINLKLKPRPKQRNLINLSTPVRIRGPLQDPNIQISKGGLAVTFFRLSLWVYTVWRDIARKPLPANGADVCIDPFATAATQ